MRQSNPSLNNTKHNFHKVLIINENNTNKRDAKTLILAIKSYF